MTTTLTHIRILAVAATIGLLGAASAPALSEDDFMAIHKDNQKINSTVAAYWDSQRSLGMERSASVPARSEGIQEYYGIPNLLTYQDIQKHFGVVPRFFHWFPETKLPALWNEYKSVQLNPNTALDAKTKQLIGLAVAVQAKCSSCIYFQTSAAVANGATGKEIQEAVAISVVEDNWSKILTPDTFDMVKQATDKLVSLGTLKATPKTPVPTN